MSSKDALAFLFIFFFVFQLQNINVTGDCAPEPASRAGEGGLVVEKSLIISDTDWIIEENVTVRPGGELVVNNTRVVVKSPEYRVEIYVEPGGMLVLENSSFGVLDEGQTIYSMPEFHGYGFVIKGGLAMQGTNITNTGMNNLIKPSDQSVVGYKNIFTFNGFDVKGGEVDIVNSTFYSNKEISFDGSDVRINDSYFLGNYCAVECNNTSIAIDNCTFDDNILNLEFTNCENYIITNSSVNTTSYSTVSATGFEISQSTGEIRNCTFMYTDLAVGLFSSIGSIFNCTFINNGLAIASYYSVIEIENVYVSTGFFKNYSYTDAKEMRVGMFIHNSHAAISESIVKYTVVALTLSIAEAVLDNCSFSESDSGISSGGSEISARNITLYNNTIGFEMTNTICSIANSAVEKNLIGIDTGDCLLVLNDNRIANNTEWGIVSRDSDIRFYGENFPGNEGVLAEISANGLGNLVAVTDLEVIVTDIYNWPLILKRVFIESECIRNYIAPSEYLSFDFANRSQTDYNGYTEFKSIIEYIIITGYEKIYCEEITVTAESDLSQGITLKNSTSVNMETYTGDPVVLELELPNIYLNESDLLISKSHVKKGETLSVKTKVLYSGPSGIIVPDFNVILYIDSREIATVNVSGLSSENNEVEVEFKWVAESDVPLPGKVESRLIKVNLDLPDDLEYTSGTNRYISDNQVTGRVEIDIPQEKGWSFSSSSMLTWVLLMCGSFILILIVLVTPVILYRRSRKKSLEEEEQEQ